MWTMAPSVTLKYTFIESVERLWNKFCITVIQKKSRKQQIDPMWQFGEICNKLKYTSIFQFEKYGRNLE